ncbi:hypothetical protein NQ315_009941 [Exocentrus adspersus]|uniref:Uncharacterized protein n=1 Tax=Exocentrus adspersus TaxID=1586481 RepID=A0AAV8WIT6_9CUCU|nr:hypothetical protein NQ315_009941 [Exocentrus adspersus]
MFWQCCRRSGGEISAENKPNKTHKNGAREAYDMSEITQQSTISNGSSNFLPTNNSNWNKGNSPGANSEGRVRTESSSSVKSAFSVKSADSFYSVKSSALSSKGDGDFYSICSGDSFKST